MSDKIINMAIACNDATLQTPEQALKHALSEVGERGALDKGKKVLIIALDDNEECFDISWYQAGMTMSECIGLCEVAKTRFLSQLGYIIGDADLE